MTIEKVLVIGASGMLGNAVYRYLSHHTSHDVIGTIRSFQFLDSLSSDLRSKLIYGGDVENADALVDLFEITRPTVVINCVGLVKQRDNAKSPLSAIPINSLFPHRVARLCSLIGGRLIHLSTDCVFSGAKGMYVEDDCPDAKDVYGRTKLLGEVDYPHALTLRTSIIGHELSGAHSLVCWFLAQQGAVPGFSRAIFSGLPTVEIARVIADHVLPRPDLSGVYHLSADPIDKFSLLKLIAATYNKVIDIKEDRGLVIDRSLDSKRFREATGFRPDDWPALVQRMYDFR